MTPPSFSDLLDIHRELDEAFVEHQYALLHFDFARAAELLVEYRTRLFEHMEFEERTLLPIYGSRADVDTGGEIKLFLSEHEKMREWLQLFLDKIQQLQCEPAPEATLLKLLDREAFYLKLCSHHDNRESRFLYPQLDKVTSSEERMELLATVDAD